MPVFRFFAVLLMLVMASAAFAQAETADMPVTPWDKEAAPFKYQRLARKQLRSALPEIAKEIPERKKTPSALEDMYSSRIIDELEQYGYDLFRRHIDLYNQNGDEKERRADNLPAGAMQDDFVLGFGDSLNVTFRGQRNDRNTYKIDSDGMLLIDGLPPVPAAGRTIGQLKASIDALAGRLHDTQVYISLDAVRQIGVLVVGHVKDPGRHNLTSLNTVLDALSTAGGIEKTGSLSKIKLVRSGRSTIIDLYALLMHGSTGMDIGLRDGDRIIIPPIGPVVAVAGEVKRPGIYEIETSVQGMWHRPGDKSAKVSLNDMLEFAAGTLSPGRNRFMRLSVTPDGKENVSEAAEPFTRMFGDGDILIVSRGKDLRSGTVELAGHTRTPGIHALSEANTLSSLIDGEQVLGPDIYPLTGVIERTDNKSLTSHYIDFPPLLVVKGQFDRRLQDGDVVHLFSMKQVRTLAKKGAQQKTELIPVGSVPELPEGEEPIDPVMASFLKERSVFIRGAVRSEGPYPLSEGVTLEDLIAVAGGLTLEASTSNIELTSTRLGRGHQKQGRSGTRRKHINLRETNPAHVPVYPGDTVRINQKFQRVEDKNVLLAGEVRHPGRYDIMPGDKLSDLIKRAGGLSPQAYPEGTIFSRESERRAAKMRFRAAAADLERAVASAIDDEDKAPQASQIDMARILASELREVEAVGRITVEADPAVLTAQPELDILLEAGDRIFIPSRPLTVRVRGEVLSPASLQFRKDRKARDYIRMAGGFTYNADKSRAFVVYPDGSAQPLHVDVWNHRPLMIPPGSTVVVPRDPKPFDFVESAEKISQIIANLALTGIWIDDLRDD